MQSSQAKVLLNYDSRYTEIVYRDATHLEIAELDKCEIPVLLLSDEIEADIRILVFSDANHESISISSCRDPLYDLITVRAYVNSYLLEELSQGDFLNLIFQNIMQEECGEGCMICTSKTNCVTCYDTGATVNNNGNCTCVDPKATFDTTTNICICPADDVCLCNPGYF